MAHKLTVALVTFSVIAAFGCGGGGQEEKSKVDVAAEFGKVQQAHTALEEARRTLDALRGELNALKDKPRLEAAEAARKAELEAQLPAAQRTFDEAYEADQNAISNFLNLTLNDEALKGAPQTREALRLYADGAVANARNFMDLSGDYGKAIDILQNAVTYFEFAGAPLPENLQETLARARQLRYLTKERFDQLKKGMTAEEVKAITGTPLYANVRDSEVQGRKITMWLFPRDPAVGGASAVYFEKGKVYALKWDATAK